MIARCTKRQRVADRLIGSAIAVAVTSSTNPVGQTSKLLGDKS